LIVPWKETDTVDQRLKFIADVLRREESMAAICRRYEVSRQTGYTWLDRYLTGGPKGLFDQSRAALARPNATPAAVTELVVQLRAKHPTWGPKKLLASLARTYPGLDLPVVSTAGEILRRAGLTIRRRRSRSGLPPKSHLGSQAQPNDTWAIDFKGQFRTGDRVYCYPLTLEDGYSRFLLRIQGMLRPKCEGVQPLLEAAFREYGRPVAIRSDNGPPFAAASFTGLTELSVWWLQHGIRLDRTNPGSPQQNGRLERFHRTLDEDACKPVRQNMAAQQNAFLAYQKVYNEERPHEAIGMKTPSDLYVASDRPFQARIEPPAYDGMVRRRIGTNGQVLFKSWEANLSGTLAGLDVGLQQTAEATWDIWFYQHKLGTLDTQSGEISNGRSSRTCTRGTDRKAHRRATARANAGNT
jgi:putative transposase